MVLYCDRSSQSSLMIVVQLVDSFDAQHFSFLWCAVWLDEHFAVCPPCVLNLIPFLHVACFSGDVCILFCQMVIEHLGFRPC